MRLQDLNFDYPPELIATERKSPSRVMLVADAQSAASHDPKEISVSELLNLFRPGDVLVLNETRVLPRRVFSVHPQELEILFLEPLDSDRTTWSVLCPSSRWKPDAIFTLPDGVTLTMTARGRPQTVVASAPLTDDYFQKSGELPLPPYIQKARGERHNRTPDRLQYQTAWAEIPGSLAAPTASLHFSLQDLDVLRARGVKVVTLTLHVGLGTFLPITTEKIDEHEMHAETVMIPNATWAEVDVVKKRGGRVWALGTTVTRALESAACGLLDEVEGGGYAGTTRLFIRPGFDYKVVDVLLTNFHQPESTLLLLVAAFSNLDKVLSSYGWAVKNKFRLFSYGDLSVWMK